jgi:exopolyphosphatase/guanosine-5'-triphosphate,3'-diphosphate pyrophosphatase
MTAVLLPPRLVVAGPRVPPVRIAAADLGSNSFHLLVVQAHPDGSFDTLVREKEMLRLGDVVARTGRITDAAAGAAVDCLRRFRQITENLDVDEVVAYGTAALREAEGSAELVDRMREEVGIRVRVISGHDEARLVFAAVRASIVIDPSPAVCLDLGGGSLEVTVGDAGGLLWSDSVKLGVARLTAELVRSDPLKPDDVKRVRKRVEHVLGPIADEVADLEPRMLVGTSGTLCDLARMAAIRGGADPVALASSVNQLTVSRAALEDVQAHLLELPSARRAELAGLESRRADLIPAGAILVNTALRLFGMDELTVGEWALREGMVLEAIARHDPSDWNDDPRAMRYSSVLTLARRCSWDEAHGTQVARLAVDLFDQTRRLHRLGEVDRELLHHAAVLHDIGEHVSVESHHKHTAYLIQHGRLRGFSPDEVAMLASIGRFHRRGDPKHSFEPYASLAPEDQARVTTLVGLLRLADGLDRGHNGVVDAVDAEVRSDTIRLVCQARGDAELERWGLRRKAELLERQLHRRIDCEMREIHHAAPADLAGSA